MQLKVVKLCSIYGTFERKRVRILNQIWPFRTHQFLDFVSVVPPDGLNTVCFLRIDMLLFYLTSSHDSTIVERYAYRPLGDQGRSFGRKRPGDP